MHSFLSFSLSLDIDEAIVVVPAFGVWTKNKMQNFKKANLMNKQISAKCGLVVVVVVVAAVCDFRFILWQNKKDRKRKQDRIAWPTTAWRLLSMCVSVWDAFLLSSHFVCVNFRILLFWISGMAWPVACVRCVPCSFEFGANAFTLTYHIFAFTIAAQHSLCW